MCITAAGLYRDVVFAHHVIKHIIYGGELMTDHTSLLKHHKLVVRSVHLRSASFLAAAGFCWLVVTCRWHGGYKIQIIKADVVSGTRDSALRLDCTWADQLVMIWWKQAFSCQSLCSVLLASWFKLGTRTAWMLGSQGFRSLQTM